jgi:hypothetical protein
MRVSLGPLCSHSTDPTSASSATFLPFPASFPIPIQGLSPDRRVMDPENPTPTPDNPILPCHFHFSNRDICFVQWPSATLDSVNKLSLSVSLCVRVLDCGIIVFLRNPPRPTTQLSPPTVMPLHPRRASRPSPNPGTLATQRTTPSLTRRQLQR